MDWPKPRFQVMEQTVLDLLTGLMWTKRADLTEFPLTWDEAINYVNQMNMSETFGFQNWRLPDRMELFSLISHMHINPCLPESHPFTHVFPGYYWSATPCARLPGQAWYIHMGGARVFKGMKQGSCMVWPVRSAGINSPEKELPVTRFRKKNNGVADEINGIMWLQNAAMIKQPLKWRRIFDIIKDMNLQKRHGYSDWRIPNIRELESLTDMTTHSPAIVSPDFFSDVQPFYWSSTTSVFDPRYAWTLYTEDGNIGVGYKRHPEFFMWPVRSI